MTAPGRTTRPTEQAPARHPARVTPVACWAVLGLCFLVFESWVLGRWIVSGTPRWLSGEDYTLSTARSVVIATVTGVLWTASAAFLVGAVRRSRRAGELTLYSGVILSYGLCFWMSPIANYATIGALYTHYGPHIPSWGPFIPGWHAPDAAHQVEALYMLGAFPAMVIWILPQDWLTRRITDRRPHWGTLRVFPLTLAIGIVVDATYQMFLILCGMYAYTELPGPTLFAGHWYQLPLIVTPLFPLFGSTPVVLMLHYARRHATTVHLYRGSERLPAGRQTLLRLTAALGFSSACYLCWYVTTTALSFATGGTMAPDTPAHLWPHG